MASKYESPNTRSRSSKKASPIKSEAIKTEISSVGELSDDDDDSLSVDLQTKTLKFSSNIDNFSDMKENIGAAPFHFEKRACDERDACDYTKRITVDIARAGKAPRKVRVYADGIYDLFHAGHARQLMQAKNLIPNTYLIVGVCNDKLTHSMKGRTVMNDIERYESLRHCRYVDEVITDAPWEYSDDFIVKHKIDLIAHDDIPYGTKDGTLDVYAPIKARGMFLATERTDGISTSDIICRIIKDYDTYVRRNLGRGYSAHDLNVGFFKEQKFVLQNNLSKIKERVNKYKQESKEFIDKWEDRSRDFILSFLTHFNTSTTMVRDRVHRAISPNPTTSSSERKKSGFSLFNAFKKNGKRSSSGAPGCDSKRARTSVSYEEVSDSDITDDSENEIDKKVATTTTKSTTRQSRRRIR